MLQNDPGFLFVADPDHAFHFDPGLDPAFQLDADPDTDPASQN